LIRTLSYKNTATPVEGLREGVLLEAGFAIVTRNEPRDITSWAYDYAASKVEIIDNRAKLPRRSPTDEGGLRRRARARQATPGRRGDLSSQ
jgi:hypothetical protein